MTGFDDEFFNGGHSEMIGNRLWCSISGTDDDYPPFPAGNA